MKKLITILMILGAASCSSETTAIPTTTIDDGPQILEQACMRVGSSQNDPLIYNLEFVGYDLDYRGGVWYFDGVEIGTAEAEDEAFEACGPSKIISVMQQFQDDIIRAGGTPFGEEK